MYQNRVGLSDGLACIFVTERWKRIRGTTPEVERAARRLRERLTPAEVKLWDALRGRQLRGLKFRCQHPIGRFIVDFYCASQMLVIEVDGDIHDQQVNYDQARTEQLESLGYRILRFGNAEVLSELPDVLARIGEFVKV